ncbi:MAG: DUF3849 domain-containing protein [Anaerotignaceae bacterium]
MDTRPFYPHGFEQAKQNNNTEQYIFSHAANVDCKNAIEKAIKENYDGYRLGENVVNSVIEEFGFDRVKYVLSHTVQHYNYDGRISGDNKAWAKETFVPVDEIMGLDRRREFLINSSIGLVDIVINQYKKECEKLNICHKKPSVLNQLKENKEQTKSLPVKEKKQVKEER